MELQEDTRRWDARAGSRLRGLVCLPLTAIWAVGGGLVIAGAGTLFPKWFRRRGWWLPRLWGRLPLWWHGVSVEQHGLEHVAAPGARLLLFNHVSVLDLFVLASISPTNAVAIYKQDFHKIPGIGHALRATGCIPVDRSNQERALESMSLAARRIVEEGSQVMLSPEGTRSRRGGLQRFKLGAFHLAVQTGAPIVPLVMRGIEQVSPMGSLLVRPGRVRVDYLSPVETGHWQAEEVRERAAEVRELFLKYLAPEAS